jgi:hypothetical protein
LRSSGLGDTARREAPSAHQATVIYRSLHRLFNRRALA